MTKTKSTKRALIMSALALLACVSMLVGSTFAWFTDSVTSSGNKIQAGSLKIDLELLNTDGSWTSLKEVDTPIFNYDRWEPGYTDVKILKVENEGSLALKWVASFKTAAAEIGKLAEAIDVYVKPSATELAYSADRASLADWENVGSLDAFIENLSATTYGSLTPKGTAGDTAYLGIALKMREEAGNEYQEAFLNPFDIVILATQMTYEEDSFNNQYDKDAIYAEHYAGTAAGLQDAIDAAADGETIALTGNINLNELAASTFAMRAAVADPQLKVPAGKNVVLNLNGYTLTATSQNTDKNYDMIDVRGTLTVENGNIITKHIGDNMEWNNSTNVFNVTAGGVLNLENVIVKNLGGSDMAIGIHLNNWGKVTLNVNNSDIYAAYCGIRAFNSGYDMNTVNITNSNVASGNMAFWVHNYTATDFGSADKAASQQKLLNLNFVKDGAVVAEANNTFNGKIRFGFGGEGVIVINTGNQLATAGSTETLKAALAADKDVFLNDNISFTGVKQTPDRNGYVEVYGNPTGFAQYGGVLDGNGYELIDEQGDRAYVVVTHGGTIKNVTIETGARGIVTYAPTENVYIDGVIVNGPGYALNSTEYGAVDMFVTNSTVNGWTSLAGFKRVTFTNCKLGENTAKYWQSFGYGQDYDRLFRVYSATTFEACQFEQGYYLDMSAGGTATLIDCTVNGVEITADNYADYITIEVPGGKTLADVVTFG